MASFKKTAKKATPAQRRSRYSGVQAAQERPPMLDPGQYRVRVLGCVEGHNPGSGNDSFKATLKVVDVIDGTSREGDENVMIQVTSGSGATSGLSRVKRFVMSAAGYGLTLEERDSLSAAERKETVRGAEEAFDAYNVELGGDGMFIDACVGLADGDNIDDRLVDVIVTRGKERDDGDFYREFEWFVVPDEEQD